MTDKVCRKCGVAKPVSGFYKRAATPDGLQYNCKVCCGADSKKWANENRERRRELDKRWRDSHKDYQYERTKKWRLENPEKHCAQSAKWRANNPEKNKEILNKWYESNKQRAHALNTKWRAENKDKVRVINQNRRARERASQGKLSAGLVERLLILQKGKCACGCRRPLVNNYHLDHIMPLALGGANTDDNIQLLLPECNLHKKAKHPVDFMQSKGFLL